jgi:NAD(P)-dependent dehydrogenase (short-subunit alcohol dehydrogenase family)
VLDTAKHSLESEFPSVKITIHAASVTDLDHIRSILKEVGTIDILVANAATSHPFLPSKDVKMDDFRATFEVNVLSTFHIIKEFLALESRGPRVVVHTSSSVGQMVVPGNIGYGPSKAAANQMIQHFATEYADTDVTFQTFHPGAVYTDAASSLLTKDTFVWEDGTFNLYWRLISDI